jgi:hypothetical protein
MVRSINRELVMITPQKIKNCSNLSIFPIQVPRAKLRFEVLFKRFHPRINLTTLFCPKIYLLNRIKPREPALRGKKSTTSKTSLGWQTLGT